MEFKEFIMNNWYNKKEYLKKCTCAKYYKFSSVQRGGAFV